ncbi:hypothetical protein [Roseospira visakhapatnamensis]|uniref:GGDEF domain-containing protein n=1 Tax=Roseospira visakhapatnamensis TaxID=390880 RepID=A0A7W6RBC8_9PROT|nr:hypothetical protein [Roseospira visakhapatnamensis]MBB4265006.1 GGDEF domain-containing protein [Roseospira visakhapatnamensis]
MADDIPGPAPPMAVDWRQERSSDGHTGRGGRHAAQDHARAAGAYERLGPSPHAIADALSVQGVPEADLTPAVRRAMGQLMGEVDRLRQELDVAREGAGGMVDVRDRAEHLPLMGARSLERAFRLRLAAEADSGAVPAVVFFYAGNYETVRERHGLAAAEAVYHAMASAMARCRADTEDLGALGGASAVMLIPFDGQVDRLWVRARALAREAGAPVPWRSDTVPVGLLIGVHVPRRGERPGDAFWQAERAARRIV